MSGGTPNHKALARCVGYGWGLATPEDREEGRERVMEFLRDQKDGHMVFGRTSELGTSSHFAWWQNALAGIWKLAERKATRRFSAGSAAGGCGSSAWRGFARLRMAGW